MRQGPTQMLPPLRSHLTFLVVLERICGPLFSGFGASRYFGFEGSPEGRAAGWAREGSLPVSSRCKGQGEECGGRGAGGEFEWPSSWTKSTQPGEAVRGRSQSSGMGVVNGVPTGKGPCLHSLLGREEVHAFKYSLGRGQAGSHLLLRPVPMRVCESVGSGGRTSSNPFPA